MKAIEQIDEKLLYLAVEKKLGYQISDIQIHNMIVSNDILVIDRYKLTHHIATKYGLNAENGYIGNIPIYKWLQIALREAREEYL